MSIQPKPRVPSLGSLSELMSLSSERQILQRSALPKLKALGLIELLRLLLDHGWRVDSQIAQTPSLVVYLVDRNPPKDRTGTNRAICHLKPPLGGLWTRSTPIFGGRSARFRRCVPQVRPVFGLVLGTNQRHLFNVYSTPPILSKLRPVSTRHHKKDHHMI